MREALVLAALLLTGCVTAREASDDPPPPTPDDGPPPGRMVDTTGYPPQLAVGRAWTYEGFEFYNEDREFTVVVADVRPDGYLFAAGAEDDLVYEALWWSRWYNAHDHDLNRVDFGWSALRFPLVDGASWAYSDELTVTARAALVETPLGAHEGFVIEGSNERVALHIEYSPLAQNIVRFRVVASDGSVRDDLRMTRIADGQPWVWYELGPLVAVANAPAAFEVPPDYDAIIASAGGTEGGRARVQGPNGEGWETTFEGGETWRHATLPATPGVWSGLVAGRPHVAGAPALPAEPPVGWGYMHVAPVRWIHSA